MFNDKGPLMFINTVNTQVDDIPQQKVYDSRHPKRMKDKTTAESNSPTQETILEDKPRHLSFLEERKLSNIIEMYEKDRPVLCNIICEETELVGIPFKKTDYKLYVKTSEDEVEEINLNEITDIIIIKF